MDLKKEIVSKIVNDAFSSGIRKTDEQDGLECYCSDIPISTSLERKIRGYLFSDNELISKCLSYSYNYNEMLDSEKDKLVEIFQQMEIYSMKEGTAIRVLFYNGKWYCTTHRKINAFKSKWGKESFGEIFEKNVFLKTGLSLEEFYKTLDENIQYMFLVGTTENTKVVSPQYQDVKLLYCMNSKGEFMKSVPEKFKDWKLKSYKFDCIEDAVDYVDTIQYPFTEECGLFLQSENFCVKIFNKEYEQLASLRNNLPSVPFAYLHNVFDHEKNEKFRKLYPEFIEKFNFYDSEIKHISLSLLKNYTKRYIKKEDFVISKYEHNILYHIHGIYLKNNYKKIDLDDVREVLKTISPSDINKILNLRKMELKK